MTKEQTIRAANGWAMLAMNVGLLVGGAVAGVVGLALAQERGGQAVVGAGLLAVGALSAITGLVCLGGHFTLEPNEAAVLSFFGPYVGTVRESGFYWANPFYGKRKLSLRARNFEGTKLKVNDKQGN